MSLEVREEVSALIKRAGGPRGAGDYVSQIVTARYRLWKDSYLLLKAAGWTTPQILAAIDAFHGFMLQGAPTAEVLAGELEDYVESSDAIDRLGLDEEVYRERVESLNPDTAYALWAVVTEVLAGNRELRERLTDGA
ncbi:MAG: hypothetical protein AAFQ77_03065 [Myxococcota bacterium]